MTDTHIFGFMSIVRSGMMNSNYRLFSIQGHVLDRALCLWIHMKASLFTAPLFCREQMLAFADFQTGIKAIKRGSIPAEEMLKMPRGVLIPAGILTEQLSLLSVLLESEVQRLKARFFAPSAISNTAHVKKQSSKSQICGLKDRKFSEEWYLRLHSAGMDGSAEN